MRVKYVCYLKFVHVNKKNNKINHHNWAFFFFRKYNLFAVLAFNQNFQKTENEEEMKHADAHTAKWNKY